MENNIELFDRYIDEMLTPAEKSAFEQRLRDDKAFASDFRIYLFVLDGIYKETEQDNMDFGTAMKNIGKKELARVLLSTKFHGIALERACRMATYEEELCCGYSEDENLTDEYGDEEVLESYEENIREAYFPEEKDKKRLRFRNLLWAGSIAAMFIIGLFTVFTVRQTQMNRIDDIIVAYNEIPTSDRGSVENASADIASLEDAYRNVAADDMQQGEEAGMRLALAYLKAHDRKKAEALLEELSERYAEDEEFAAQCRRILKQLE